MGPPGMQRNEEAIQKVCSGQLSINWEQLQVKRNLFILQLLCTGWPKPIRNTYLHQHNGHASIRGPRTLLGLNRVSAWALCRPHDCSPPGSQLPCWLQALPTWDKSGPPLPLMHGSRRDRGQRNEEEHVPLVDLTVFPPRIFILQRPRRASISGDQQCCHDGQLVSKTVTVFGLP